MQNIISLTNDQYPQSAFAQKTIELVTIDSPYGPFLTGWFDHNTCCWLGLKGNGSEEIAKKFHKNNIVYNDSLKKTYADLISDKTKLLIKGTPFQLSVWQATYNIPSGKTRTYGEIAKAIGNPKSMRAVGQALNVNSIGLLIPCHRVTAYGGKIGGFAHDISLKESLLQSEKQAA
jgi:methylated-DNA-[protein]-cysteine S-methyltransferase